MAAGLEASSHGSASVAGYPQTHGESRCRRCVTQFGRQDVAASTVIKLMQHAKATGSLVPKRMGGYRKYKLAAHDELVRALVKATPDATLDELVEDLGKRGIETSRSGLDRYLGHIGWSFKKNSARIRTEQTGRQSGA